MRELGALDQPVPKSSWVQKEMLARPALSMEMQ